MAKYARVTTWQVQQLWAASDLKPHRLKTFKISNDPHFANKVVDVVGLYLNPPDNALVLSGIAWPSGAPAVDGGDFTHFGVSRVFVQNLKHLLK